MNETLEVEIEVQDSESEEQIEPVKLLNKQMGRILPFVWFYVETTVFYRSVSCSNQFGLL